MQKQKTGKISIFSSLGAKLGSLAGRVGLEICSTRPDGQSSLCFKASCMRGVFAHSNLERLVTDRIGFSVLKRALR